MKLAKEHDKQSGKWISKTELQKLTKGKYPIHSQSIQAVVHKYIWARDAAKKAREQGITTVKYPYKLKKNFNVSEGFKIYENGKIDGKNQLQCGFKTSSRARSKRLN